MQMKPIRIDEPTYQMLKKISPRKDAIGLSSTVIEMIRAAYDSKK